MDGRRRRFILTMTLTEVPVNSAAPTLSTSTAVIGAAITVTPGTWTAAPTLTYQWQRNTGTWADISGATSSSYTPVDADFGYALRVQEIANGDVSSAAASSATGLTREQPTQSFTIRITSNNDFASGSTGWTVGSGWSIGSGIATKTAGSAGAITFANALINETWFQIYFDILSVSGGGMQALAGGTGLGISSTVTGKYAMLVRRSDSGQYAGVYASTAVAGTVDNVYADGVTFNTQLAAPSANMRITQLFTLPGTPAANEQVYLILRSSDFTAGNYLLCLYRYTGAQWNINVYSVTAFALTSQIAATNIGSKNGIRVNMNGTSVTLETTTDGGSNWSQHGSTTVISSYSTATGVNVACTNAAGAGIALGNLIYEAAS